MVSDSGDGGLLGRGHDISVIITHTAKLKWVRPPQDEPKEFDLHLIVMTDDIDEWSVHDFDSVE